MQQHIAAHSVKFSHQNKGWSKKNPTGAHGHLIDFVQNDYARHSSANTKRNIWKSNIKQSTSKMDEIKNRTNMEKQQIYPDDPEHFYLKIWINCSN